MADVLYFTIETNGILIGIDSINLNKYLNFDQLYLLFENLL